MRVFVVDDDPDARELVRETIESEGWTPVLADDGIAALGAIRRALPDVIVLDLRMPNLDGVAVLELLRSTEVGRRIPVVVTTGLEVRDHVRALASAVLVKPFSPAALARTIRELVRERDAAPST